MRISIIQTDLAWLDKEANLENFGRLLSKLKGETDIVILPEMFNTGFCVNPEQIGEDSNGQTFKWMSQEAEAGGFAICGSYIVREGGKYFNRWLIVTPEKMSYSYDKHHLFSISGEDKLFTRGENRLVFAYRGVRISPYICYDLRFPVWMRNRNDCDLIIVSANWPESRRSVWNTLLKARALENQCYVAGSNRIGIDGEGIKYCGDSVIINPKGEIIALAEENKECCISGKISIAELMKFRARFPVWKDADDFTLST
jgi:omega-amidase